MQGQQELDLSKLAGFRQPSSLCCASQSFCSAIGEFDEPLPCIKDVRTGGLGTPLQSLS